MLFEVKNLFKGKQKNKDVLHSIQIISNNTDLINREIEQLDLFEFNNLKEKGSEYFISFSNFLYFIDSEDISLESILKRFKHVGELVDTKFSCVDVYATPKEEGILLTAEPSPDSKSDKIQVISVRKKR
jgi:hypothetical protein